MRPQRHFQRPQRTLTDIRNEMLQLLCACTDEAFARLSVDVLAARYSRLRRDVIAADYAAELKRREGRRG